MLKYPLRRRKVFCKEMLKIIVFDSGYGGELFADYLIEELPIIEIVRVIDWRNAEKFFKSPRAARKTAEKALRPYIGTADLIVFVNHLLSITSLRYFQRKYKKQKFLGLNLEKPATFIKKDTLILTTKAIAKTVNFRNFIFKLRRKTKILTLDSWPSKIDDGELSFLEIKTTIKNFLLRADFSPQEIILACAHLNDIKSELADIFGKNVRIYDGFKNTTNQICRILNIRGGAFRKVKS